MPGEFSNKVLQKCLTTTPTMKQLREQKEKLLTQKDTLQKQYDYYRDYQKELHTVCRNVDMILGWNPPIQTTQTKEFQL